MDNRQLWESVLVDVELSLSKASFSTWFKGTSILKQEDGTVQVAVPNQFVKEWLTNKYHKIILKALRDSSEHVRGVEYVVTKEPPRPEATPKTPLFVSGELPLSDYYINKEDNLNPRYTFENFVVGPFNELAYAAAQAVIKKPGIMYNPLFVYGNTGHGKTHLIQAVGNYFKTTDGRRVYYVTSEKFGVDYVNALRENKVNSFKEKYRSYDVLVMDDIQFFSQKTKIQEELFHLFNSLYENNKQLVFSSDKDPVYIPSLEDRLKSRFIAGMKVDIPPPDYETRVAILKTKVSTHNLPITEEAYDYIAATVGSNIRELEGALNAVLCQTQLKNRGLSLSEVRQLIKESAKPKRAVSIKDIIKTIADFYDIEENIIFEKTRKKEVVKPRQIIMYILREDFKVSYPTIGEKMGGRDHTTVIHSCEKVKQDVKEDPTLSQELQQIRSLLQTV